MEVAVHLPTVWTKDEVVEMDCLAHSMNCVALLPQFVKRGTIDIGVDQDYQRPRCLAHHIPSVRLTYYIRYTSSMVTQLIRLPGTKYRRPPLSL